MSASLVGSEMCIRDSQSTYHFRLQRSGRGGARDSLSAPTLSAPRATTVSYTHLTLPTICSV
eukprot:7729631-Alexandrium_andersonii.AAC.1